ncbi:hypothetical protein CRN56_11960 [Vibrio vulnificus Env1]|nr:hypothetical protein CRN56_11960 [Vibrio vulnificus Env1]
MTSLDIFQTSPILLLLRCYKLEVFMEHDLKAALIITATVFAVLLSFGFIAITAA